MRIDASGNVGIGEANPGGVLDVRRNQNGATALNLVNTDSGSAARMQLLLNNGTSSGGLYFFGPNYSTAGVDIANSLELTTSGSNLVIGTGGGAKPIIFAVNNTERARFDTNGYLKASNFGAYSFPNNLLHEICSNTPGSQTLIVTASSANPYGQSIHFSAAVPNNATNYFLYCQDTNSSRAVIRSDGGLANFSANNANISDESVKDYITPYDKAELDALENSFTDVIWGKFKYRDQTHDDWNHGPTAQGVERAFSATAPELVDEGELGVKSEDGKPVEKRKVIYETDLTHIAHALLARALKEIAELKKTVLLLLGAKPAASAA
jgi:hypothetical protein